MKRNIFTLILSHLLVLLFCVGTFAGSGEEGLKNSILALEVAAGKTPSASITKESDVDGDQRIGLGEAIYIMQTAAGVPFFGGDAHNYKDDFLISALAFEVATGNRQEVVILDTPRVGLSDAAFNRKDLLLEVIRGEGCIQIQKENPEGSEKGTRYYIQGTKAGMAEIRVSYPGYTGQETVIAVHVVNPDPAGPSLKTDIALTKYDVVYFTGDSTNFSFGVTIPENTTVFASSNGKTYPAENNTITLPLQDGYNRFAVTATGDTGTTTKLYNIRAKKVSYAINNLTRKGSETFYEGDKIAIAFSGLVIPVPKVSRIYNPSDVHVSYACDLPRYSTVTGAATQYDVDADNSMKIELTGAGDFTFTKGHVDENWFGSALYAEAPVGSKPPVTGAGQTDNSFSILPDIHITVQENAQYAPQLFTAKVMNTEDIWPKDEVVVSIPDLDIDTIAKDHPVDPVDGWWIATLIDSNTRFVTDIPTLDQVKSQSATEIQELENLKTIRFTVPENTEPGTYHIRGGYVWVKHGPDWWTRETDYFKAKIPDLTIEVKKPVPGQVHGVVPILNSHLKSKLALALNKGEDYTGGLTSSELKSIQGKLDLSGIGLTDNDLPLLQYLKAVTAIDLSGNPALTADAVKKENFDWTVEKTLDFSGCTGIGQLSDVAFRNCENLKAITLPETVTRIGLSCFEGCTGLTAISLPAALTDLGDKAFKDCASLASVTFPAGLSHMGKECFASCDALTQVSLPDGITILNERTFAYCDNLTTIHLPASLETVGEKCFYFCEKLSSVSLPETVTTLSDFCFQYCRALHFIALPANLRSIGDRSFCGTNVTVADFSHSHFTQTDHFWQMPDDVTILLGEDLHMTPATLTLQQGGAGQQLSHDSLEGKTLVWASGNPAVASVENGLVKGLQAGQTVIYVKASDNTGYGICHVTVTGNDRARLASLSLSGIELEDPFTPDLYHYTASIAPDIQSTIVTATAKDNGSTLAVNGSAVSSGSPSLPVALNQATVVIKIQVTTDDNAITKTYCVTLEKEAVVEKENGDVALGNGELRKRLAMATGKDASYQGAFTTAELAGISGNLDLSAAGITDDDMSVMKYLTGVSAIDLSHNTEIGTFKARNRYFDWTTPKSLNFQGCTGIKYWNGFKRTKNLTGITVPESISSLRYGAMQSCPDLVTITLPDTIESIGGYAFSGCTSLQTLTLPESVTSLDSSCFSGSSLETVNLPKALTELPDKAFRNCKSLKSFTVPAHIKSIGNGCFEGCTGLKILDLTATDFHRADANWKVPATTLIRFPGIDAQITGPANAVKLGEEFPVLSHKIPAEKTVIWTSCNPDVAVISETGKLTGVKAGSAILSVSTTDGTYSGTFPVHFTDTDTPGLTGLAIPGVAIAEPFDTNRFVYATELAWDERNIQIVPTWTEPGATVSVNGKVAQSGIPVEMAPLPLGDNTIAITVTTNGKTKTYQINARVKSVQERDGVLILGRSGFKAKLAVAAGKPADYEGNLTTSELAAITGSLDLSGLSITDEEMAVMQYLTGVTALDLSGNPGITGATAKAATFDWTTLESLSFKDCTGITELDARAFSGCSKLKTLTLPETLKTIGAYCFYRCAGLTELALPSSLSVLETRAFYYCTGLTTIRLPQGLTHMGTSLFYKCTNLAEADLSAVTKTELPATLFEDCEGLTDMSRVIFPKGITRLPDGFFTGCSGLKEMMLPDTITHLGDYGFKDCEAIATIDLRGMTELGKGLLQGCDALTGVTFPAGITELPEKFFSGCTGLTEITLPDTITTIGKEAFSYCPGLKQVTLPPGITQLPEECFYKCAFATLEIPDSVTSLGEECFNRCDLRYLALPAGITTSDAIGKNCFEDAAFLTILDLRKTNLATRSFAWNLAKSAVVLYPGLDAGLSPESRTLTTGQSLAMAHQVPSGKKLKWITSNPAVATVANGNVKAVSEGMAVIAVKATDNSYSGICRITVSGK